MNRSNRGYELGDMQLGAPSLGGAPNLPQSAQSEIQMDMAQSVQELADLATKKADEEAKRSARVQGIIDAKSGNIQTIDPDTLAAEEYYAQAKQGIMASAEMELRKGIGEAALIEDLDEFNKAANAAITKTIAPIKEKMAKDPRNIVWTEILDHADKTQFALMQPEILQRQALKQQKEIEANNAARSQVAMAKLDDAIKAQREFAALAAQNLSVLSLNTGHNRENITPDKTPQRTPLFPKIDIPESSRNIGVPDVLQTAKINMENARQEFIQSLVMLGPKEAFELNGVKYEADKTRAGVYNLSKIQEQIEKANVKLLATEKSAFQEKIGDGKAQEDFAKQFAKEWRDRVGEYQWLSDDDAQDIEDMLFKAAGIKLNEEENEKGELKEELSQFYNTVQYSGRLSAEQIQRGDILAKMIDEPDVAQMWENAKKLQKLGRRFVGSELLSSVRGGAIPFAAYNGATMGKYYGYAPGRGGGSGKHIRVGGKPKNLSKEESDAWDILEKNLVTDPVAFAHKQGLNVPKLNVGFLFSKDKNQSQIVGKQLSERMNMGASLTKETMAPLKIFSQKEAKAINSIIRKDPMQMINVAKNLSALGDWGPAAMAELGLSGTAEIGAMMAAGGIRPDLVQAAVLGTRGKELKPSKEQVKSFENAKEYWQGLALKNHLTAGKFNDAAKAAKEMYEYEVSIGRNPNPHQFFSIAFGTKPSQGKGFGGMSVVNGGGVLAPDWFVSKHMQEFLAYAAPRISAKVYDKGKPIPANKIAKMQLYHQGGTIYSIVGGYDKQGRPQLLTGPDGKGYYAFDMGNFYKDIKTNKPDWVR